MNGGYMWLYIEDKCNGFCSISSQNGLAQPDFIFNDQIKILKIFNFKYKLQNCQLNWVNKINENFEVFKDMNDSKFNRYKK